MPVRKIGNITVRDMYFPKAGDFKKKHAHKFDHCSMLIHGRARVETWKAVFDRHDFSMHYEVIDDTIFAAPQHAKHPDEVPWMNIEKGTRHQITALMDGTYFWCVYASKEEG